MVEQPHCPEAETGPDPWVRRVLAAQDGTQAEQLFRDLLPWWLRLARRLVRDSEEANDVVQEASLRLWRSLGRFDPEKCHRSKHWLARFLVNCAIDRLRRRRHTLPLSEFDLQDRTAEADDLAQRREQAHRLHRLLAELPHRDREALRLRFERGLTYADVGAQLGVSLGTAYRVINKALQRLASRALEAGVTCLTDGR